MSTRITSILAMVAVLVSIAAVLAPAIASKNDPISVRVDGATAVQPVKVKFSTEDVSRKVVNTIGADSKLNARATCVRDAGTSFDCQYANDKINLLVQARVDDKNVVLTSVTKF